MSKFSALRANFGESKKFCVYDRRLKNSKRKEEWLETSGLDFHAFHRIVSERFSVPAWETFVLVTTERTVVDLGKFQELPNGTTLYMLHKEDQALEVATEEPINFTPHHNTVVESGTFKYYDSEGKKALPYALADLVDNALTATAKNKGARTIEIRMLFDESRGKPAVIVLDNGCGMTTKQLNNWAVYKLNKFTRENSKFGSNPDAYVRPDHVPRSLNSDISYFGVGGKQAVFYIGKATRVISKPVGSPDVHELVLSKALFEKKEKNKEDTYSTTIRNRRPGDSSHIKTAQEAFLHDLIAEECKRDSFTAVVITEVLQEHIHFLKEGFEVWARQLAHIYHYYIHGVNGNDPKACVANPRQISKLDIQITLQKKNLRSPYVINLRNIKEDMQTLYIRAAASTFEFKAITNPEAGVVEGIIRYHPFLYDRETYPKDPDACLEDDDDNDNDEASSQTRKRPGFECYWNGRLIPYTTVSEFDWSSQPKGSKVPAECYHRFSGVLFTDDTFKVTENKLTFIDLEQKLKNKDTAFSYVVNGQKQRSNLQKEFTQWLQDCHEKHDKQVKFKDYKGTVTRTDVPKRKQHPWATFSSIEWDGRVYKTGQLIKSQKTNPIYNGTVVHFLLFGNYDGDVFATGGQVEICLEPKGFYDKTKIILLSKLDRNATVAEIKKNIDSDLAKLPDKLLVEWPNNNPLPETFLAGTPLGPIKIDILSKKGESLSRMPSAGQSNMKKLAVVLKLVRHDRVDREVLSLVAQHSTKWGFWFKEIDNLVELGKYTLHLNSVINESNVTEFGDKQLPCSKLRFTIIGGKAATFDVGTVSPTLRIGVPFDIPLGIKDSYGHAVEPPPNLKPVLQCSGLDITYDQVITRGNILTIRNVRAIGELPKQQEPNHYLLKVTLRSLKEPSKDLRISLIPGNPYTIHVLPKDSPITLENGDTVQFTIVIQDEAGNITAHPKITAQCRVPNHPPASVNCMTGIGQHVTKPINLVIVNGQSQKLTVQFSVPSRSSIPEITREVLVLPSKKVSRLELYKQDDDCLVLKNNEKIQWMAGGLLENLFFKLYDEANREVPVTAEMASKIKVNWTGNINQTDVIEGKLPDVQVPTKVHDERFYQVSYQDQSVSVSFNIVPLPDEPARLNATLPQCKLRLGEVLPLPIVLDLVDQHDNVTKTLTPSCVSEIKAEAEGLDKAALVFTFQESSCSVMVTGVCFNSGSPGYREMSFTFRSYTGLVKLELAAGFPAKLELVSSPPGPLQILNGHGIPAPFLIQLCDKWGNLSPDQRVVVHMCHSPPGLKVKSNVSSQPVNAKGQVSFTINSVTGPKGHYQINFECVFNKEPIVGPSVDLTVLPDPTKPASLHVKYDTRATFTAGGFFPVFSVTVISDEGSPISTYNPGAVSMLVWKGVHSGKTPPDNSIERQCSKPMKNEKKGFFYFREKPIPEHVGEYTIQFCLREPKERKTILSSDQILINVVANQPVKLAPDVQPETPVVFCSEDITKRIVVDNMTLRIMDQYGNPAGQGLTGNVEICIKNSTAEGKDPLPLFEGKTGNLQFKLVEGKAHISRLAIMENSPGVHSSTYVVLFKPVLSARHSQTLASFELPFRFCNDSLNQQKILELSRKRDELKDRIEKLKNDIDIRTTLITDTTSFLLTSSKNVCELRNELNRCNINIPENAPIQVIGQIIKEKSDKAQTILNAPRRIFDIPDCYKGPQDVLGMVGHLAWVRDDGDARVISWHIQGDIDCVITTTTGAARRIYNQTGGRQQVMPLDSIHVYNKGSLPHIRNGHPLFEPLGNPVFATDLLIPTSHPEKCDIVFRNIVGNTILIDDLDSANAYRKMVVQHRIMCPTILTRQGERISAKGKFGGAQNKAPPIQKLHVFGAPLPEHYDRLKKDIDLLSKYKNDIQRKERLQNERDQMLKEHLPEMKKNEMDMEEIKKQLQDIEQQLATPVRPLKRVSTCSGETSGLMTKRAR